MHRPVIVALGLAACGSGSPAPPPASPPGIVEPAARAAFRSYAARVLAAPPGELRVDDQRTDIGNVLHNRGRAHQYMMWRDGDAQREVRGWVIDGAAGDDAYITSDHNLGRLFVEAGIWSAPASKLNGLADDVSRDIVWSWGMGNRIDTHVPTPTMQLAPDGSGNLHFIACYEDYGSGGGGGAALPQYTEVTVALTANHTATLTKKSYRLGQ